METSAIWLRPSRAAGRERDERVLDVVQRGILAVRADGKRLRTVVEVAARDGHVVRAELLCDRGNGEVVALEARGVGLDRDFVLIAARNIDGRYAVQALERRGDLVLCDGLERRKIRAAQRDLHDRHGVDVDAHDGRVGGVVGKLTLDLADLVAQVGHRVVEVGGVGELNDEHRHVLRRGGLERIQTGQTGHRALERLGDLLLDVLRPAPG